MGKRSVTLTDEDIAALKRRYARFIARDFCVLPAAKLKSKARQNTTAVTESRDAAVPDHPMGAFEQPPSERLAPERRSQHGGAGDEPYEETFVDESEARFYWTMNSAFTDSYARVLWAAGVRQPQAFDRAIEACRRHVVTTGKPLSEARRLFRCILWDILEDLEPSRGGGRGKKGNLALARAHLDQFFDSPDPYPLTFNQPLERRDDGYGDYEYRIGADGEWCHGRDLNNAIARALEDLKALASYE
jgi:hypothetical protein